MLLQVIQTNTSLLSIISLGPYSKDIKGLPAVPGSIKSYPNKDVWVCDIPSDLFNKLVEYNASIEGISFEEAKDIINSL